MICNFTSHCYNVVNAILNIRSHFHNTAIPRYELLRWNGKRSCSNVNLFGFVHPRKYDNPSWTLYTNHFAQSENNQPVELSKVFYKYEVSKNKKTMSFLPK